MPARGVQGVVDYKFPLENLVIAQTESPESRSNPAETFSCRMRIVRMRIGRADDLTEKDQGRVSEVVFLQNGVERNVFAVVTKLAIWDVEDNALSDPRPVSVPGKKINSASRSTNFLINHGHATRSTLIFSRVIHFII